MTQKTARHNSPRRGAPSGGDRSRYSLHYDDWGRLVLTDGSGRSHVGVEPVRAFPISDPDRGISLCDAEGKETFFVDELGELPDELAEVLSEDLARREFVPVIERIVKATDDGEFANWRLDTDRGATTIRIRAEDALHKLSEGRIMVVDIYGVRYLLEDINALDSGSRKVLDRYI